MIITILRDKGEGIVIIRYRGEVFTTVIEVEEYVKGLELSIRYSV